MNHQLVGTPVVQTELGPILSGIAGDLSAALLTNYFFDRTHPRIGEQLLLFLGDQLLVHDRRQRFVSPHSPSQETVCGWAKTAALALKPTFRASGNDWARWTRRSCATSWRVSVLLGP